MDCKSRLEAYLRDNGVEFRTYEHPTAFTAQEIASVLHVSGKLLAKVVMAWADRQIVMLVLAANDHVDFNLLADILRVKMVRLAHEGDFAHLFPDCAVGAMPPFGNLYNIPVYLDQTLAVQREIVFQAGTHMETIQIGLQDYIRLVKPVIADLSIHTPT